MQGALHRVEVVKGLAHAHEDEVAHGRHAARPRQPRALPQLREYLLCAEVAPPAHAARRAEEAALRAAHLARYGEI